MLFLSRRSILSRSVRPRVRRLLLLLLLGAAQIYSWTNNMTTEREREKEHSQREVPSAAGIKTPCRVANALWRIWPEVIRKEAHKYL